MLNNINVVFIGKQRDETTTDKYQLRRWHSRERRKLLSHYVGTRPNGIGIIMNKLQSMTDIAQSFLKLIEAILSLVLSGFECNF